MSVSRQDFDHIFTFLVKTPFSHITTSRLKAFSLKEASVRCKKSIATELARSTMEVNPEKNTSFNWRKSLMRKLLVIKAMPIHRVVGVASENPSDVFGMSCVVKELVH